MKRPGLPPERQIIQTGENEFTGDYPETVEASDDIVSIQANIDNIANEGSKLTKGPSLEEVKAEEKNSLEKELLSKYNAATTENKENLDIARAKDDKTRAINRLLQAASLGTASMAQQNVDGKVQPNRIPGLEALEEKRATQDNQKAINELLQRYKLEKQATPKDPSKEYRSYFNPETNQYEEWQVDEKGNKVQLMGVTKPGKEKSNPFINKMTNFEVKEVDGKKGIYGLDSEGNYTVYKGEYLSDADKLRLSNDGKARLARIAAASKKGAGDKGKELTQSTILKVNEGRSIPSMLDNLSGMIDKNATIFGPVSGRIRSNNPYDAQSQEINAEFRAKSQAFGRYMEGGVLRKEDEEKYRKMFPQLSDTPKVAKAKLEVVDRLVRDKHNSNLEALEEQGFDTKGLGLEAKQIEEDQKSQPSFPRQVRKDGQVATVSNEEELKEAQAEGWN